MQWLQANWFWIAIGVFFLWMRTGMHGGHGGHRAAGEGGGHGGHRGGCCGGGGHAHEADEGAPPGTQEHEHAGH